MAADQKLSENNVHKIARYSEQIAFYGVLLAIFLTSIPYATVQPWSTLAFVFFVCLLSIFRITEGILSEKEFFTEKYLFVPLIGILLVAIIQIIPLPGVLPADSGNTISQDVFATKNFILTFIGLLISGEILNRYTNSEKRIKSLIILVLTVGIGSALFGCARLLFPEFIERLFSPYLSEKIQFAQFVNKNHFAYLMEMSLGILLGLQLKGRLAKKFKPLFWLMTAVCSLSIILANTRGGILSMGAILLLSVCLYFFTKRKKKNFFPYQESRKSAFNLNLKPYLAAFALSVIITGGLIFMVAFVGGDPVARRLGTIESEFSETQNDKVKRLEIWTATLGLIKLHPILGIGFGAYPSAVTEFDQYSGKFALRQAHNDYLELFANGGVVSFGLALIFSAIILRRIFKQLKSEDYFRRAVCFGATTGIFGVMFHSVVDFGLHVILNALVFIILIILATKEISDDRFKLSTSEIKSL